MLKTLPLCLTLLLLTGCYPDRPARVSADTAMKHFNDQIANHCPGKPVDPEKFNELAKDYRNDADTQSQQLIDLDTTKACTANNSRPECYNAGFLQAEIQMGGMDEIVKQACNAK
jgi:hypothetical protein